ncbi:MAG: GTPase, partial [Planctomycetota bacterium]
RARLLKLRAEIRDLIGAPGERRSASPRAVLAGPPSAGKSTLFNALLGRERAVVHDRPGTTRDAIAEPLKLDTRTVTLVDLAGLEAAGDADAQAAAFSEIKAADLVLWCDPDGSPPDERLEPAKTICIRTKADRPIGEPDADVVEVCALDGRGLAVLRGVLAEHALAGSAGLSVPERHAEALRATEARLESACTELAGQERALASPELVAGELRLGLDSLGAITGRVDADEILGRVFSGFCVGK